MTHHIRIVMVPRGFSDSSLSHARKK